MDFLQIAVLALVQGLTEFLPISSSAHLILVPRFLGWPDQGLAFDVAVHVGSLTAVVWYLRVEVRSMMVDWFRAIAQRRRVGDSTLAWAVAWGTVPVGLAGLLFGDWVELYLRSPVVIAATTIGFGLLLWGVERTARHERTEHQIGWRDVLVIGCAQVLALIPGTSRSGITITAALAMGLDRPSAARFSFLLSIPVILLAGGVKSLELAGSAVPIRWDVLALGTLLSAVSAYACIHFFLKIIERIGMMPFVAYRLVLGVVLVIVFV